MSSTDITIVLDRTGSMANIKTDTIGGFNQFIDDQKKVGGKCTLTLVQFDSQDPQEIVYDAVDIKNIRELTDKTFVPRGWTPLYDALGLAVTRTGQRLSNMNESERPDNVVFVIITDGEENASTEYKREQVFDMIKHQTDVYKWQFVYLGANQDAMKVGASIGTLSANTITYDAQGPQVRNSYALLSANVADMRKGARTDLSWTADQRKKVRKQKGDK